ncbi:MAG: major capsid protein [Pyrinomonadaceae bacterium MAG19_C2-C3]|nr:major capsid protein [Pyrinomonadaceae bacterium MAG19_C2-C3]
MTGITYTFPTNHELNLLVQEYSVERETFMGEEIMPFEPQMTQRVMWDDLDSERGMTHLHNMDTDPRTVGRPGSRVRSYEPIFFKEQELIKESDLLMARQYGTLNGVINIDELVMRRKRALEDRAYIRAEQLRWMALGGEVHLNENGVRVDETFPVQHYYPIVPWTATNMATPLADFLAQLLLYRGTGATATGATAYMNQTTANVLLSNTNANDIAGFRATDQRSTTFSIEEANRILAARGCPQIKVYDMGYIDEAGQFQTFIADGEVRVVGKRPGGQRFGAIAMTPSLHRVAAGLPASGMFCFVTVNGQPNMGRVSIETLGAMANPKLEIVAGFYGGPLARYGRSIINMHVFIART